MPTLCFLERSIDIKAIQIHRDDEARPVSSSLWGFLISISGEANA